MAETTPISDHYERMAENLPTQFRDKPNIDAIVVAWTNQTQELEDHLNSIPVGTRLHRARGVNLDRYGTLLGLSRPAGASDDEWFSIIAGRIVARSSDSTVNSIRKTTEAVTELFRTNIIEYNNKIEWVANGNPKLTGDVLVYGYYNRSNRVLSGFEGELLRAACPVTTNTAIFGQHIQFSDSERSLYIPCELILTNDEAAVIDAGDPTLHTLVTDGAGTNTIALAGTNIEKFGKDWENGVLPEDGKADTVLFVDTVDGPFEDLLVNEQGVGLQRLNVVIDGVATDHGIFLEISTSI